jgi:predicted RNase H-like HicB family nuclease
MNGVANPAIALRLQSKPPVCRVAELGSFAEKRALASLIRICYFAAMKARFTYWQESDGRFLGYLNDYPDHWTQGESLDDLKEHLRDLFQTFSSEQIPGIRKVEELEVA